MLSEDRFTNFLYGRRFENAKRFQERLEDELDDQALLRESTGTVTDLEEGLHHG